MAQELPAPAAAHLPPRRASAPDAARACPHPDDHRGRHAAARARYDPFLYQLRYGQPYSQVVADQALKDLYATELFSDVQIRNEAGNVVIEVKENPVINRIVLEGNKRIKEDKILPEIKLAPRQIFTRSKVRADVSRIIELYKRQGRFAADGRAQDGDARAEPRRYRLRDYRRAQDPRSARSTSSAIEEFSARELRGQMVTKQASLTRMFSSGTSYDPDRMAFDQQKLRQFYLTKGYADFRVVSAVAELTPDKKDFILTYVVEEGKRYKFGEVKVESQLRDFDGDVDGQATADEGGRLV